MYKGWIEVSWQVLIVRGLLAAVFGVVAMVWPSQTAVVLCVLWGIWALVDGVSSIALAFRPGPGAMRAAAALLGVVALIAAFFAIFRPGVTVVALTWILGIWLLIRGGIDVVLGIAGSTAAPRWLMFVTAALDLLLGILFVANPGAAVTGLAFLLGLTAFAWGLLFVGIGMVGRRASRADQTPPPAPSPA